MEAGSGDLSGDPAGDRRGSVPGEKDLVRPSAPFPASARSCGISEHLRAGDGGGPTPGPAASRLWQTAALSFRANVEDGSGAESAARAASGPRTEALLRQTFSLFREYAQLTGNVPEEVPPRCWTARSRGIWRILSPRISALRYDDKQAILEELSPLAAAARS